MFGDAYPAEKASVTGGASASVTLDELANCPNSCTYNGVCKEGACYCQSGFYGSDCSSSNPNVYTQGEPISKAFQYGLMAFAGGILIGKVIVD